MAARHLDGSALLVAGHGAIGALDVSVLHTLGQIGEALLATGDAWQIRRLAEGADARAAVDRGALKQQLDELSAEPVRSALLVLVGTITEVGGEPVLVTSAQAREYPEDATLPLAWIRERLAAAKAEQLVAIVSGRGDGEAARWLAALGTQRPSHVIAAGRCNGDRHPLVESLLAALCGDALDRRTGTVTMASLSQYLERQPGAVLQGSEASETLAQPPPLGGLWDVRRSQLSLRGTRPRASHDPEDLTGAVLPGRFRCDKLIARGTFGAVYRARQLAVERDVAVKVLHPEIDPRSEDGRLFVHEVHSVGRIAHRNVVQIHQADITHDGRLFFAMELLDGSDLQKVGADGPLPRERAIELVCQLLDGLGAAHHAGLVHADIKPANAMVVVNEGDARVVLVDFGLSRLRAADRPTESAGGTPAYMAPEQMHFGRVDARSDLFSVALVLVYLLTGWRRPNPHTAVPSLESIPDADLRAVLARALEIDPAKRYGSARELAAALTGVAASTRPSGEIDHAAAAPFRQHAPLTEADRGRLHGRETELAAITEHALYRRCVIYTAPSGTGKTSLLRAGLVPRLEALGVQAVYVRCRADCAPLVASSIMAAVEAQAAQRSDLLATQPADAARVELPVITDAIAAWQRLRGGKLVLILDQLEAALGDPDLIRDLLAFDRWGDADVAIVLSVREDHLARLIAQTQPVEPGIPITRLPPLGPDGARAAITNPLTTARLAIEPELLDLLLADLQRAAAAIGPEMGWGTAPAVFPPHLQLACSVLYEALPAGEATLTVAHYRRLGGFDAIVGEHLERVLDTELTDGDDKVARALFIALVTATHERAMRAERAMSARVGDPERSVAVLEALRARGLVVRVRGDDGELHWELAHDSLVPRVLAWIDRRDLAKRRAIELVRYHLRRSTPGTPSLLGRAELRELRRHPEALVELEAEWQRRTDEPWTPRRLVKLSRRVLRSQMLILGLLFAAVLAVAGVGWYQNHAQSELRARDLGRMVLELEPFGPAPIDAAHLQLRWELHTWGPDNEPGPELAADFVRHGTPEVQGNTIVEHVEVHGGRGILLVHRGACGPSVIPLDDLPGYAQRESREVVMHLLVPTCEATLADTIPIPAGPFYYGGPGAPPSALATTHEAEVTLPAFRIDKLEVTNAAYDRFAAMSAHTGRGRPHYAQTAELMHAGDPDHPVTGLDWYTARAFCRYMGKDLPTSQQWVKAMRGGLVLPSGAPNPAPRRNLPWGDGDPKTRAQLDSAAGTAAVGSHPDDLSPYGVLDLAGNVQEWTVTKAEGDGMRIVRGGGVDKDVASMIIDAMAIENPRDESAGGQFDLGLRCAQ